MTSVVNGQYYFGRNKIQYTDFDWRVLKTDHFDIYYYPEEEELARAGAHYAEVSFKLLQQKFNFAILEKIPLIFYSSHLHFQQTNTIPYLIPEGVGGFFEFIKGRVVIPNNGSSYQFQRVIRHELTHVFMFHKIARVLKNHRVRDVTGPPLWFTEGLAEYWSTGWDSQAEMVIRDALLNDYLVPLHKIDRISGSFLMYKEGQSVLKFIDETYGPEKILLLMENFWKDENFERVMELTIGKNYRQLSREWVYSLKKRIYPMMKTGDLPGMLALRITEEGINTKAAYYPSSQGEKIVYFSNRFGYGDVYMKDLKEYQKGERPVVLVKGERTPELESIHLMRSKIDVNPEGLLVFVSKWGEGDRLNVFDIEKRGMISHFGDSMLVSLASPVWSPDGGFIAFSALDWRGYEDLYLLNWKTRRVKQITNDFYADRDPSFSPDGRFLAFSSDRGDFGGEGYFNLFTLNLETGKIDYLTQGRFNDLSPTWCPPYYGSGGGTIVFSSDRGGGFNLWAIRGENALQLTHFTTGAFDPEWTPDGLLFSAFENYSFQIRYLEPSGGLDTLLEGFSRKSALLDTLAFDKRRPIWVRSHLAVNPGKEPIPYKRRYSLDIAQSAVAYDPVFGFLGGAQLSISDLLGNSYYHFLIYNTAETPSDFIGRFNLGITRVDLSRRTNLAYGLFHFARDYFDYVRGFYFERMVGGHFSLSYPFSVFRRVEIGVSAWHSDREPFAGEEHFKAFLFSNFLSFVKDNSLWGPVGPIDGDRARVTLGHTVDFTRSRIHYYTILGDFRRYFRTSRRTTFALRLMGWMNGGKDVRRFYFGGSWDLRGYRRFSIVGSRFFLLNNEFRFPFIEELIFRFPVGDFGFAPIRGAAFFDVGNAWDEEFEGLLGSFGVGLRGTLGGVLVLRLDFGKTTDFHRMDPGIFTQFFFGWNY